MMENKNSDMEFNHIRIGGASNPTQASSDDDVVIIAGIPENDASDTDIQEAGSLNVREDGSPHDDKPNLQGDKADIAETESKAQHVDSSDYQGTTLEDIKSSKMPKAQLAVIIVAIVCLAAFIIWYAVFS